LRWTTISVRVPAEHADAVSNVFFEAGSGVQLDEPASSHSVNVTVKGYLAQEGDYQQTIETIRRRMAATVGSLVDLELDEIENEDWAVSWRESYKPFRVGRRLLVKPSWEQVKTAPDDLIIELDPGMAFGCGTHPTTATCMVFLEKYLRPGMRVYDVGTGSGILAITASRLGAAAVYAVDEDPMAVRVARENIAQNGLEDQIQVGLGDLLDRLEQPADIIVANILAEVVIRLLPMANARLVPGGLLIAGGISAPKAAGVLEAMKREGFEEVDLTNVDDWVSIVGVKR
jgi:ribosomal protein L11 methyltransferase